MDKDLKKVQKLRKGTNNELASELSHDIKVDALQNAKRFSNSSKGKSAPGVKDALRREAELLD